MSATTSGPVEHPFRMSKRSSGLQPHPRILAARCARSFATKPWPSRYQRAQGRPGARRTRGLACKMHKNRRTQAYRFGGNTPAFPAQWLYGLYDFVLVTGFLATIISVSFRFHRLDASTGASDPNDFAVRKCHARQSQPSRPSLPAPRPRRWPTPLSDGTGWGFRKVFLPDSGSEKF